MEKKYEFTGEEKIVGDVVLHRIKAVRDFANVKAGDVGGWIEKEENLSHGDNARVSGDAWVYGNARVSGNAWVSGNARVSGNAWVYGNAEVSGDARVYGNARVSGDAWVSENTHVFQIGPIGSRDGVTTFYHTKNNKIGVKCGCFCGDIDEFEKRVQEVHSEDKHGETYALAIALAKAQIELDEVAEDDE